jgi:hypothetical protein
MKAHIGAAIASASVVVFLIAMFVLNGTARLSFAAAGSRFACRDLLDAP